MTVHADRGSSMTSKPVAYLLADLGVTRPHNRPCTSSDNPDSEAHFKTLKYRPAFPARFASIEEVRGEVLVCVPRVGRSAGSPSSARMGGAMDRATSEAHARAGRGHD